MITNKLIVILVPEHNVMSGGIYSFFSIAKHLKNNKAIHEAEVIVMTRPNMEGLTYVIQTHFRNEIIVYRFEQLTCFAQLEDLTIFIPEESASTFYKLLTDRQKQFLSEIRDVRVNIMNQNIRLMPSKEQFADLYKVFNRVTQTTAHHRYCSQEIADKYQLDTLLIPPYTDLTAYPKKDFEDKKNVVLYSPDNSEHKTRIIEAMSRSLPGFEFCEIRDLTFDEFMGLVTDSKFMITFGEGFDGYFAQSFQQGGISFCVYNQEFFPDGEDFNTPNVFHSYDAMHDSIVASVHEFDGDPGLRARVNRHFVDMQNRLYSKEAYVESLVRFCLDDFDYRPSEAVC